MNNNGFAKPEGEILFYFDAKLGIAKLVDGNFLITKSGYRFGELLGERFWFLGSKIRMKKKFVENFNLLICKTFEWEFFLFKCKTWN